MKSAFGRINPSKMDEITRDEIRLRRVYWQISFNPRLVLRFHLNAVKISSAFADFITAGDFIFFCRPIYILDILWYNHFG